jgi:hypothetical protein
MLTPLPSLLPLPLLSLCLTDPHRLPHPLALPLLVPLCVRRGVLTSRRGDPEVRGGRGGGDPEVRGPRHALLIARPQRATQQPG